MPSSRRRIQPSGLLSQLDVEGIERLLQDWMSTQIGDSEPVETLAALHN